MAAPEFRRFLTWTALVAAAGIAASVALVLVVDPYRLYGGAGRPGFNAVKPQPVRYQKQIKVLHASRLGADTFIVGNSRAEIGFDPAYPGLAANGARPYNLALAGTRLQVAREQLEELAAAGRHPKRLLVGAEFLDFPLDPAAPQSPPPLPERGRVAELTWRFNTLFSIDSVWDAARTVRLQSSPFPSSMTELGFNPLLEYKQLARDEGYYALFSQRAQDYRKRFERSPRALVSHASGTSREFEQLEAVVAFGIRSKAPVDIVIYPYHAQIMALYEEAGMLPLFDEWKNRLAALTGELRAAHPAARIRLWDFSGYSPYHCERIPARGDRKSETRWYWEAGHFKAAFGNRILARILDEPRHDPQLGMELSSASLAANRERIAAERAACLQAYPELFGKDAR